MQRGHHDLCRGNLLAVDHHVIDGNATAVVHDGDGVVGLDRDFDLRGETGERFVDRVVDDFIHQMVQSHFARRADIHRRTLAHGFHAAEHFNGVGIVVAAAIASAACRGDRRYFFGFCFGFSNGSSDFFGGHSAPRKCPDFVRIRSCSSPGTWLESLSRSGAVEVGSKSTSSC